MKANNGKLKDNSPMPDQGKFESVKMANIPAKHLLFLYDNKKCSAKVKEYIEDNLKDLRDEVSY